MAVENEKEETCSYEKELTSFRKCHAELLEAAFKYHKAPLPVSAMLHVLHSSMMDFEIRFLSEMNKAVQEVLENENAEKRDA